MSDNYLSLLRLAIFLLAFAHTMLSGGHLSTMDIATCLTEVLTLLSAMRKTSTK